MKAAIEHIVAHVILQFNENLGVFYLHKVRREFIITVENSNDDIIGYFADCL